MKPATFVAVPPPGAAFVTDTDREPVAALTLIVIVVVSWDELLITGVLTVMPEPKSTDVTPR